MSGFEVVGVVLGVVPLAITALEHAKTGKGIIGSLLRWECLTNDLIRELNLQNIFLDSSVRTMVANASIDGNTLAILRETSAAEDFRDYLGARMYVAFLQSLEVYKRSLTRAMAKLMEILGLETVRLVTRPPKMIAKPLNVYCTDTQPRASCPARGTSKKPDA